MLRERERTAIESMRLVGAVHDVSGVVRVAENPTLHLHSLPSVPSVSSFPPRHGVAAVINNYTRTMPSADHTAGGSALPTTLHSALAPIFQTLPNQRAWISVP